MLGQSERVGGVQSPDACERAGRLLPNVDITFNMCTSISKETT